MTRTTTAVRPEDDFGPWYRFRTLVVFNLLSVAGPAHLEGRKDPRVAVEEEYERRRDLHRARRGLPVAPRPTPARGGVDVVVLCAVGGVAALVLLLVWAVLSAR